MDPQWAREYVRTLVSTIDGPIFENQIAAQFGNVSEVRREQAAAKVRVALLMSSLALLYHTETGSITRKEMTALMSRELHLLDQNMGHALLTLIAVYLKKLPMAQRGKVASDSLDYIENADVGDLADSTRILVNVFR